MRRDVLWGNKTPTSSHISTVFLRALEGLLETAEGHTPGGGEGYQQGRVTHHHLYLRLTSFQPFMLEICSKFTISCPDLLDGECPPKPQGHLHIKSSVQSLHQQAETILCQTSTKCWEPNWLGAGESLPEVTKKWASVCIFFFKCVCMCSIVGS